MDLIRIVNTGNKDLVLNGNERIVIKPGASRIVQMSIAASWFGDPRAQNDSKVKGRDILYNETRHLWGFNLGFDTEEIWEEGGERPADGVYVDRKKPQFECYDVNEPHDRVYMLLDDPMGEHAFQGMGVFDPSQADNALLQGQVDMLTKQMATLVELMQAQNERVQQTLGNVTPVGGPQSDTGQESPREAAAINALSTATASGPDAAATIPPADPSTATIAKDSPKTSRLGNKS